MKKSLKSSDGCAQVPHFCATKKTENMLCPDRRSNKVVEWVSIIALSGHSACCPNHPHAGNDPLPQPARGYCWKHGRTRWWLLNIRIAVIVELSTQVNAVSITRSFSHSLYVSQINSGFPCWSLLEGLVIWRDGGGKKTETQPEVSSPFWFLWRVLITWNHYTLIFPPESNHFCLATDVGGTIQGLRTLK